MKTNFFLCLLSFCLTFTISSAQELYTDIHGKKVTELLPLEKQSGGKPFEINSNFISLKNTAQPLIFRRTQQVIPDLLVYYTFSKQDSLMDNILYEWDVRNFNDSDNNIQSPEFQKVLIAKYQQLLTWLTGKYGVSTVIGDLSDLTQVSREHGMHRSDRWQVNDSTDVYLYTSLSNYYKQEGSMVSSPTHRIRLYINNIRKKIEPLLSEEDVKAADLTLNSFLVKLKAGEFAGCREYLSVQIRELVPEEQLTELRQNLQGKGAISIMTRGFQPGADGNHYLVIQYRYGEAIAEAPKEILQVVFDAELKILAIAPLKR